MGTQARRIPLPAPTDISSSALGTSDDLATDISRATDRTSYSIPEDGSPVTITTKRSKGGKDQSQTTLLIEYYEPGRTAEGVKPRPSVRVRVTPSGSGKARAKSGEKGCIQITETGKNRKPSYTRRISLPHSSSEALDASEISESSSGRPPVEVEVLQGTSDLSQREQSPTRYYVPTSDVSSIPPDSLLDGSTPAIITSRAESRAIDQVDGKTVAVPSLKAPVGDRDRSVSRERLAQSAMKKIQEREASARGEVTSAKMKSMSRRSSGSSANEYVIDEAASPKTRSRRSSERGALQEPSEVSALSAGSAAKSSISARSNASSINNPKLLSAVEDAIKKLILPELTSLKEEQARVKEEQARQKNRMKFEEMSFDSKAPAGARDNLRRVSKSSSSPNVRTSVLSDEKFADVSESVRSKKSRRSSRGSDASHDTAIREEASSRRSSREKKHSSSKVAAAAMAGAAAGGALTAAALQHHDSIHSLDEERKRRKRRSKSRSRSASLAESVEVQTKTRKADDLEIPALPTLQQESAVGTDVTRDSILSAETDRPQSPVESLTDIKKHEIKKVSTGSPRQVLSPEPRAPSKTSGRLLAGSPHSERSVESGGRVRRAVQEIDLAQHERVRSLKSSESLSSNRKPRRHRSNLSVESIESSPQHDIPKRQRPIGINLEHPSEVLPDEPYSSNEADPEWFEKEHQRNEELRREYEESQVGSNGRRYTDESFADGIHKKSFDMERGIRDGAEANPEYVHTPVAVESAVASLHEPSVLSSVHSSQKTDSALDGFGHEGSVSRDMENGQRTSLSKERWEAIRDQAIENARKQTNSASPRQSESSLTDRPVMGASAIPLAHDQLPEPGYYDNESEITTNPSLIKGPIGGLEHGNRDHWPYDPTPTMGPNRETSNVHEDHTVRDLALGASAGAAAVGLGLATARSQESAKSATRQIDRRMQPKYEDERDEVFEDEADGVGGQQHLGYASPSGGKGIDEGYMSGAIPGGEHTPDPYSAGQNQAFDNLSLDNVEEDDAVASQRRLRYASGLSHGMSPSFYDAATGKGIDRIKDRDVVALMDHLTVRDAHRNARDTEILVTLVRTAAEMRNQWEDMKKFMQEQDRMVMAHTDRVADKTVQRLINGPRPYPGVTSSAAAQRGPRRSASEDTDDSAAKKKNLFRRAFKNLGSKNQDLTKIESMLMQLLNEVEDLKAAQIGAAGGAQQFAQGDPHSRSNSMDSYNELRNVPDPGYEPEGMAGTSSSPAQSAGHLSNPSSKHGGAMHSGYDARRSSEGHRISTVLEGDEEDEENWTPQSAPARGGQYINNDGMLTPTQEIRRQRSAPLDQHESPTAGGGLQGSRSAEDTPVKSGERKSKHKSGASWLSGKIVPISRWSKTTASTVQENQASGSRKDERPYSQMSRSGSNVHLEAYDDYDLNDDDRLRSRTSLDSQPKRGSIPMPRSASPLIPEERRSIEDPKYQAHRNSLNLQHPQPRQGPTHRHQTYLETQAIDYGYDGPDSDLSQVSGAQYDQWGNTPALALNRLNRFSGSSGQTTQTPHREEDLSPVQSDAYSERSASEQAHNRLPAQQQTATPPRPPKIKSDDGPLVPPKVPFDTNDDDLGHSATITNPGEIGFGYHSPYSNSGMHIASPLEPIEEVRYSLETDRSSVARGMRDREDLTPSPRPTAMQSITRKITGPREMPFSARKTSGNTLTVPRKPVASEPQREKSPGEFADEKER
ncbi:hypothetical protein, variant 2 [Verruconis gallopava]|uniref:Transaldolase n=1 Tax=Verruconis gallopava TaxID=253628 RepID=A0A0D1YH39_9PEZI|nr:hypothetical protein, variant 1 [Verruconis gallopava]XP_016210001.1 hypothetical protein, variant 2 [Verruconis gallopava]KIW00131.1 hypothetical protein, variant 1 [Verruconis gallopava]KIW00132.1 hypothetical protein, variant 2 [Verruconis gallopava]